MSCSPWNEDDSRDVGGGFAERNVQKEYTKSRKGWDLDE